MELEKNCRHVKPSGERCRALARTGNQFCFFHDPASAKQRSAARQAGGRARCRKMAVLPMTSPDVQLRTVGDVVSLLETTVNQMRTGTLDVKVGNAIGFIASIALRAFEAGDTAERMRALEERLTRGTA